jgi:CXXC-20-CXXC protein
MKPFLEKTGKKRKGDDKMVRCTNCDYKWKTKEVLAVGFAKHGKTCPNCGKKQYLSKDTQHYLSLGYVSLLFLLTMPFVIKLSDREEHIW